MPAQQCCVLFSNLWAKWVGTWLSNTRGFFWEFLLILETCWNLLSKYANLRIFWRLGTYFQNNSFVSSHIDLFWLPGFTEEKKNDCPVSNPYLLICRKRLTQICQMFFWRHVGTYCPNMAISDFFFVYFPQKNHLYHSHPNLFVVAIMHRENKQWLPSAWLVFGNQICWCASKVFSQNFSIFLAACWNLLSKYGEFRNVFPHNLAIWGH